jgi:aminoglycoside phosphotransferase (APT) family kinase protein
VTITAGVAQGELDVERLAAWIGDRLPGSGHPHQAQRMGQGTGEANALYRLRRAGHTWVLRRPPATINAPGASDMEREWRILVALEGTAVPHPQPRLLCEDAPVLGATFLIMDKVDGVAANTRLAWLHPRHASGQLVRRSAHATNRRRPR